MGDSLLQYLILSEGGATALLATALTRPRAGQPTVYHRSIWQAVAKQLGLALSDDGPEKVLVEDGNLDLVLLWDDWCIVLEVKIRASSVRGGQLQDYYDLLRNGPEPFTKRFPGTSSLCLAFLTPENVGVKELECVVVAPPDGKVHLTWENVLAAINSALDAFTGKDRPEFFEELLRAGTDRIAALVREIRVRSAIVVSDEQRLARRRLALDVQAAVSGRHPEWTELFRPPWTAPTVEEVYLSVDSSRRANAYFTVFSDSLILPDEQGSSSVQVRYWFKVADKHRQALRPAFAALDPSATIAGLELPPELAAGVLFDNEKLAIHFHTKLMGLRSELVAKCSDRLEKLVLTLQNQLP